MEGREKFWGVLLSIIGMLAGLYLFYLIASIFMPVVEAKLAMNRPDEGVAVKITFSMLSWIAVATAGLWGSVLYGFLKGNKSAAYWGVLAASLQLLASYFPMIPPMSVHLPAPTVRIFILAFILWLGMLIIRREKLGLIVLLFFVGIAFVMTYMDGVATISRYQTTDNPLYKGFYAGSLGSNWIGATGWLVFLMAALARKKWAIYVGVFAALTSMFAGYMVSILEHRVSMFLPAPVLSTILLIVILLPSVRKLYEPQE